MKEYHQGADAKDQCEGHNKPFSNGVINQDSTSSSSSNKPGTSNISIHNFSSSSFVPSFILKHYFTITLISPTSLGCCEHLVVQVENLDCQNCHNCQRASSSKVF